MKKHNCIIAILTAASLLIGGAAGWLIAHQTMHDACNYSNEMKSVKKRILSYQDPFFF
ncbi:MAG: hypothetical protein IKU39_01610 [Lachnospiraceae bacterium]|nr:hypothetical protein [Lachnospiraceae bacterium]